MTASPVTPRADDTETVLGAALRELHGAGAQLEAWTADPLTKHGKHRVVRYDLHARVAGAPDVQRYQWVRKFYGADEDARTIATVLRQLAATGCGAGGRLVIPRVVAYDATSRALLLTYEAGKSVTSSIAREGPVVLAGLGRALAVLHAAAVSLDAIRSPAAVLGDLRPRIAQLCAHFPGEAVRLRSAGDRLEREAPAVPPAPSFLHGDLGPAQLLWRTGSIVMLDFDTCTRGDPALDLGSLLTQLRRLTLRKPGKLPDFAALRSGILDAYRRSSPHDPGLARRVAWYERTALLRKIHSLTFDLTRHPEAEAIQRRQAEAIHLLELCDAP